MAEIHFFMTQSDTLNFCRFLSDNFSCVFTMDGADTPKLTKFNNPKKVSGAYDPDGYPARFFFTSPLWSRWPLLTQEIHHHDGRHRWYVRQRYGGPAFDFSISKCRSGSGDLQIITGWISDYPWYYIRTDDPKTFNRPESMSQAFNSIKKFIRSNGKRSYCLEISKHGPWIIEGALTALEDGATLRQGEYHFDIKR